MSSFLVPYDFSAHSDAALALASQWASRSDAEIRLLHVVQEPLPMAFPWDGAATVMPAHGELRNAAEDALAKVAASASGDGNPTIVTEIQESPNVAEAICDAASRWKCDLIVMGTHGTTGFFDSLLGSVAQKTIGRAPCPVLTLRSNAEGD